MSQPTEQLDFSGLFKLDVIIHLDVINYTFYEIGLKKFLGFSSSKELVFIYIDSETERCFKNYDWDFVDNPVHCMCFEPSGTWILIISDEKILLVPFLPLFKPQHDFDHKWSLSRVTVLPLNKLVRPMSVVWWLTKDSKNILIIGCLNGTILFYCLESQGIVNDVKVSGEIKDMQICFDDSLDLLVLLISGKTQHWKLVLEHRSFCYNWLHQSRSQGEKERKDGFMSYIRQLSKDKITLLMQGGSKDENKSQSAEHVLHPVEYLPLFRKGTNNWDLTSQYLNGRHFLTAFEINEGTLILETPEEDTPSRTLKPCIKKDGLYLQGLWSQKLIYLLRKNSVEVHSANFSVIQGETAVGAKRDVTELWSSEVIGDVIRAHVMSVKETSAPATGWREPTFLCDLQLPRFGLDPCLIITTCGVFVLNTVCSPCEWLVGVIMRGGVGAEQSAAALGAPVATLLRASSDMLLSRGKIAPAQYLYSLSQSSPDGWVARLGVFGKINELCTYKPTGNIGSLGSSAITVKLLSLLLNLDTYAEAKNSIDTKLACLTTVELSELAAIAAALGLWDLLLVFSVYRGHPDLMFSALKSRGDICRGGLACLLGQSCIVPFLLEEKGQWLLDYITERCHKFDTYILKLLCLWLNPLQDELRPVMRDLKQGIPTPYTTRIRQLISTFAHIISIIESREPCPEIHVDLPEKQSTWRSQFNPRRSASCGLGHWAVANEGNAYIMLTKTKVIPELVGRVIDVACGRHHTLLLTENGVYAAGDNTYGQLGVGVSWAGPTGDAGGAGGALLHVRCAWTAPLAALAAGHYHSAAVDMGGRLYTWGWGVHGQLGLGSIDDKCSPQLVTKFQGRKVLNVCCGACHTVVLMRNGEVWACGAGVFGQLGTGGREKSSLPIRVPLADPMQSIAVGYFHNLGLSAKGELWCWGASPQQVRASQAKRNLSPETDVVTNVETHLWPHLVDTRNITGRIVHMAAGWHHSCVVNNFGSVFSWGLNFDGQLGSGDRKQIQIPTEVPIGRNTQTDAKNTSKSVYDDMSEDTKALVSCGGDFTIYIDDGGKIYATGNMHQQGNNDKPKGNNRVIMMKTTKRVIKIPASKSNNKFLFHPVDRFDFFPVDVNDLLRTPLEPNVNPLTLLGDFDNKSWADHIVILLKPWINEKDIMSNTNMAAKFAFHKQEYSECLKLLLESLKRETQDDEYYSIHTEISGENKNKDEHKIAVKNIVSQRIKEISLCILNEKEYPEVGEKTYQSIPCSCNEPMYLKKEDNSVRDLSKTDLAVKAASVLDKCIKLFPIDTGMWDTCFRIAKDFYVENSLSVTELESVFRKYMKSNVTTVTSAIMYSDDCAQYNEILSPKFLLNMCSEVLDNWR